jgi:homoserine O-acetyltransferase
MPQFFFHDEPLQLEGGGTLPSLRVAYDTFGTLNSNADNVIWVCHALTASSDVSEWWPGLFGNNKALDPAKYFIVCANILGSHYGTTGPLDVHSETGKKWYTNFPFITVKDMVNVHRLLKKHLGIRRIHTLIGGSLGGQQALEWVCLEPDVANKLILLATNAQHSPWGIAFNESQRLAIQADPTFGDESEIAGLSGLKAARSIALLSYRNYKTYQATQTDKQTDEVNEQVQFRAAEYQNYQGEKLVNRFNAYSYVSLSKAMDAHHVGRGRNGIVNALNHIQAKTLVIGITSDILFPVSEQKFIASHIPGAIYSELDSIFGHDGFLTETTQLNPMFRQFIEGKKELLLPTTLKNYNKSLLEITQ